MSTTTTKKAFDLARNSIYVASPEELCVIGGAILSDAERGPLDTAHKLGEHDLFDERLTAVVITDAEVANVDFYGVIEPVVITKDPETGLPTVVDGRGRVRRARRANILRAARGEPALKIECKVIRSTGHRLMGAMIALNEVRNADGPLVKLEKAKRLLERGVSEDDAAVTFGLDPDYFRALLAYDDTAIGDVKEAVSKGELSTTAAAVMVRTAKTAAAQKAALDGVRERSASTGRRATVKDATDAAKRATGTAGANDAGLIPSRRELSALSKLLAKSIENAGDAQVLIEDDRGTSGIDAEQSHVVDAFFVGAEAMLRIVLGKGNDATLLQMLEKARKAVAK